ncbi:ATP-binding protein [Sporichthya polymorpha]|uniref:ATP-binding protein n=1 Tax=Sporichthya polymorpha TaxID=35751 RepID=UPI00036ABD8C|nr:ATP-binding protein [Sporichthya polymorpha]
MTDRQRSAFGRWWSNRSLRTKGVLVLALPLLAFVGAAVVFLSVLSQTERSQDRVDETRQAQDELAQAYRLVIDGETGIRGYLATGDRQYLAPTRTAQERLPQVLDNLTALVGDTPEQAARLARIRVLLDDGYQLRAPPRRNTDAQFVRAWIDRQKASTDELRELLSDVWRTEDRLLADRLRSEDAWVDRGTVITIVALGLGIAGGVAAMLAFTVGVTRRLERVVARTDGLREGEVPNFVDPGRDEIGVVSRRLTDVASRWQLWKSEAQAARVAAEEANQAKSEFLSRMSHELRTPLNAVLGFAQLLEMDLPEGEKESARQIRRAGAHLLDLINEVLDISRIEAGQLTLSLEPVRVSDVVGEVVELMAPLAADHGVALDVSAVVRGSGYVLADRQRTKQIVLNLVSNAVKYNRPGGFVVVRCHAGDPTTAIEVTDNGVGIAAEDLVRLFTPFERLGATNSEIEGTGVGLALSQRLASAMEGRIEVESERGAGSTFRLVLPSATAPTTAVDRPTGEIRLPAARASEESTLVVLAVEDNPANVRLLQEIVSRRPGWRLVTAGQGQLGLDLAIADPPDLVLLDLHLPDLRGEDVLMRLRAEPSTAAVPVVVVSADATPGRAERIVALGAADYFTKPIQVGRLLALLDDVRLARIPGL